MRLLLSLTDQSFTATKSAGIFNVSMGLARGLAALPQVTELHLLGNAECADSFRDMPQKVVLHLADKPVPQRFGRVWWDQAGVSAAIRNIAPDWAILPKGFPPYFPNIGKTKLACYLHDVNWEYYVNNPRDGICPYPAHELMYFRTLGLHALKKADVVLTSTHFNKSRFRAYVPKANIAVVGIGFDEAPRPIAPRAGKDILFFGSPYPHKLTPLGMQRMEAWLSQRRDAADIRIRMVGHQLQNIALPSEHWCSAGRIPRTELQDIMERRARVAVYFSDYEGFGMPPVECLRAGLPCVASDIPAIRENIPECYLFDNLSESAFIRTMNAAFDAATPPPALPDFPSWNQVAERTLAALQRCDAHEREE